MQRATKLTMATDESIQTVTMEDSTASPQLVYLDFDGAATFYVNADLGIAVGDITVKSSGFGESDIAAIVASLNGMFDDVVFTSKTPSDGAFSTVYVGVTSAFDRYGRFLGLAETIDSGNQIHDDNAFVMLDSTASVDFVTSIIAHETEHIVHGMDHGGENLHRFAADYVVSSGVVVIEQTIGPGTDTLLVENGGLVLSATIQTSAVMTVDNGGMVSSATVNFNGIAHVSSGGVVSNATLNNGSMYIGGDVGSVVNSFGALVINAGGEVQSVTISNGGMSIGGTVVSTTLSAGVVHVNGGTANTMTMHNGTLMVYSGGVASSLVISKGQVSVLDGGKVENTTVNVGATLTVSSGASATGVVWTPFQGKVNVQVGGFATFVNSGYYYGSGNTLLESGMSISEIEVGSGNSLYVFDNGLVENATVNAGGTMTVANGGVAENTTVDAGGTLTVWAGASATGIIWTPFQGEVNVAVGGYATFDNSGYYYGSGNALWDSGLSILEIEVDGGCSLYVFENGLVENATVYEGGVMTVFNGGVAGVPENGESGSVLIDWGTLNVGAGGEAQNVTLDGGSMTIGGTVVRTSLCAGTMTVSSGTANSTTMQAGTLEIMSGGLASSLVVSSNGSVNVLNGGKASTVTLSGAMTVSSGGVAEGVSVSGAGVFTVDGGSAKNINAYYDNGTMTVINNGRAEKMELHSGGTMVVASGGVLYDTMLRGGCSMIVHDEGLASAVSVSGVMNVFDGGVASGNTIEYGTINLSNGGVASDTTMNGGTMNIASGGTALNIIQAGGSLKADLLQTEVTGTNSNGTFYVSNGEASNFIGELMVYGGQATNMTVEAGHISIMTIYDGGEVSEMEVFDGGTMNVYSGGLASETTINGGTMNLYSSGVASNMTIKDGTMNVYSSGVASDTNIDGGTMTITKGGVVSDTTIEGGAMNVYSSGTASNTNIFGGTMNVSGGTASAVEAMGGTLNVAATAELDGADIGGATVNVASGVVARNLEVNAGTLNVKAGADVDGITYNGGTFIISSGVTIKNFYKIAGGTVNMYGNAVVDGGVLEGGGYLQALAQNGASGAVIRNYELRGGAADAIIVRAGGNKAENIAVYGGALHIQSGASASEVDVYDGGTITTPDAGRGGATMENIRIHAGGQGVFAANAARAMTIDGLTMDEYAAATFSSANVADFNATGGELTLIGQKNYVSGGGTLEDITVLGNGQLWINDPYDATSGGAAYAQMVNSNLTVEAGATVLLLGTNVHGSDAQIWGKYYVQNGATLSGGVVHDGGKLNLGQRSNYNDNGVRAKAVGVTINSNGTATVTDGDFINMTMEAGAIMNISSGGVASATTMSGGTMNISNGGVASTTTMSGGTMNISNGGTHSGTLSIASGAVVSAYSGAVIDFTMAAQEDKEVPLIDHYDYIAGAGDATYTLTIASALDTGSYALAGYATDFNSTITVNDAQQELGSLSVNEILETDDFTYSLFLTDGTLFLGVNLDLEAPVLSSIVASPEDATNQDVTVTATFTDNVGVASTQYRIDSGAWQDYEDGVVMTANGTVDFQATDAAGNVSDIASYIVTNIDKTAPTITGIGADITTLTNSDVLVTATFADDVALASQEFKIGDGEWTAYTSGAVVTSNATVQFKAVDTAGNSTTSSFAVENIDKDGPQLSIDTVFSNGIATWQWVATDASGIDHFVLTLAGEDYTIAGDSSSHEQAANVLDAWTLTAIDLLGNSTVSSGGLPPSDAVVVYSGGELLSSGASMNGLNIQSDWSMVVSDYGLADSTTVNAYGEVVVSSGGTANSTTVNAYGDVFVSSGGTANSTTVNSMGRINVSNGGTANSTTVNSIGMMYVSSGGTANITTVNVGGEVVVSSGGTAKDIIENGGAVEITDGVVVNFVPNVIESMTIDIYMTVHSGTTANAITLSRCMNVYSGGTANSTMVNRDGEIYIFSGGTANATTVNNKGSMVLLNSGIANSTTVSAFGKMIVSSGGTANATTVNISGSMALSRGGTATDTTVNNGGRMFVSSGGTANATTVNNGGEMMVDSGGTAMDILENGGMVDIYDGAVVNFVSNVIESRTLTNNITIHSGTTANAITLDQGTMYMYSGGTAVSTTMNSYSWLEVYSGGMAVSTTVNSCSWLQVSSGGIAVSATVNDDGSLIQVYDGGVLEHTVVNSGGSIYISSGGMVTGALTLAEEAVVYANDGGIIDFDISELAPDNAALVNDLSLVQGTPTYTITISATQAAGAYVLAEGAANFTGTMTVTCVGANDVSVTVDGDSVVVGDQSYSLAVDSGKLLFTIAIVDTVPPTPPVASASTTEPTNQSVMVFATFSEDSAQKKYSLDGQTWSDYGNGVEMADNGTVYFRGIDAAGNISEIASYTVSNIDITAPTITDIVQSTTEWTSGDVTVTAVFADDVALASQEFKIGDGEWTAYTSGAVVTSNATVQFKAVDTAGNSTTSSFAVENIDKTSPTITDVSADVTAPTNGNVTVTATFADDVALASQEYKIGDGEWTAYTSGAVITNNATVQFRAVDSAGNSTVSSYEVTNIDKTAPTITDVSANITTPTNSNVLVTASFADDVALASQEYKIGDGEWTTYTSGAIVTSNATVHFRAIDSAGNSATSSFAVENIDKTAPTITDIGANVTAPTNNDVLVTASFADDVALDTQEYKIGNGEWTTYTNGAIVTSNATVQFRAVDSAGNSTTSSFAVENIDKVAPTVTDVSADVTEPTSGNVTVTATFSDDVALASQEYKIGDGEWTTYTSGAVVTSNATVQFRAVDSAGNISDIVDYEVTNIDDQTPPILNIAYSTKERTNELITLTVTANKELTKVEYTLTNGKEWIEVEKTMVGFTFTRDYNGSFKVRGTDAAGNVGVATATIWNVDRSGPERPTVTASTTKATNQNVLLTASWSDDSVESTRVYSFDRKTWLAYTGPVEVEKNCSVYFRSADDLGNIGYDREYKVTNIDKTAPNAPTATLSTTKSTNQDVTVKSNKAYGVELLEFSMDGESWSEYTGPIVFSENGSVKFRATDAAGNVSPITTCNVSNIDKVAPDAPVVTANVTKPTNGSVLLTATWPADAYKKQFSLNGGSTWNSYSQAFLVKQNTLVLFRAIDKAGNISEIVDYEVTNINDHIAPELDIAYSTKERTNQLITLTVTANKELAKVEYTLTNGKEWIEAEKTADGFTFTRDYNGSFDVRGTDVWGNVGIAKASIWNVDRSGPERPTVTASTKAPTNQNVTLTAAWSADSVESTRMYSFDRKTWLAYTGPVEVESNCSVYFRSADDLGNIGYDREYKVTNIDKVAPNAPTATLSTTKATNQDVTVKSNKAYGVVLLEFSMDGETWSEYTGPIVFSENGSVKFRATDAAGNVSPITTCNVSNIDKVAPEAPVVTASVTTPTTSSVLLTATWPADAYKKQFSLNGGSTWSSYSQAFLVKQNTLVLFRAIDKAGNISEIVSQDVNNILPKGNSANGNDVTRSTPIEDLPNGYQDLLGSSGDDLLLVNQDDNLLFGASGNDHIVGTAENDVIAGGAGNDSLIGSGGDDLFVFGGNWGQDTIEQLEDGKVTLWFDDGDESKWNAETLTYTDGDKSVAVSGVAEVTLKFGDDGSEQYRNLLASGAFSDLSTRNIFEDKGMLA